MNKSVLLTIVLFSIISVAVTVCTNLSDIIKKEDTKTVTYIQDYSNYIISCTKFKLDNTIYCAFIPKEAFAKFLDKDISRKIFEKLEYNYLLKQSLEFYK